MTGLQFLILALALWGLREFALGTIVWRNRGSWRRHLRTEQLRFGFGCARCDLMQMAASRAIDHQSSTFRTLYFINTYIMRRPDQFPAISRMLRRSIFGETRTDRGVKPDLAIEARSWTPEIRGVATQTGQALGQLLLAHSWPLRILSRLAGGLTLLPTVRGVVERAERPVEEAFERRQPDAAVIRQAKEELELLAAAR